MSTTLSGVGLFWAFLSVTASLLCCSGYYLPYWIQGKLVDQVDAYFSSFRRCNYPRVSVQGMVEIVQECGRYTKFSDIPSLWWQCTTILIGAGCALTILVAITVTSACCSMHIVHNSTAKTAGLLQLVAALLVFSGAAVYPIGWDNRELRHSCGNTSAIYKLGSCQLSWSIYLLGSAIALLILCFALSFYSVRDDSTPEPPSSFRLTGYPGSISTIS